ncbi:Dermonecrotic toxin [Pseudomonas extremaustralis]|uniref:Dermonecrotic toxin n=1 Tax=Pseudomonas extremaustralis TaxID=359110 RepID=A0A5M9IWU6_9PSED|nr:DUF6543 domain-containing protein [Pseudomonas extremaustralis]KAA8560630.1 Dermonecrotic toxin [Pseudomonas extremaustralis]
MSLPIVVPPPIQSINPDPALHSRGASNTAASLPPRTGGDSQLVDNFLSVLNAGVREHGAPVQVPPNSTLGRWRTQLAIALKNPDFQNWLKEKGIAPASIVILPDTNAISASINHHRVTFGLNDHSGWSTVAGPILAASKVVTRNGPDTVHYNDAFIDTTELGKVADFYGVPDLAPATVKELDRTRTFAPIASTDTDRSPAVRGEQALAVQQRTVANIYKRHERIAHPAAPGDAELVQNFTHEWQKKTKGGVPGMVKVPTQTVLGQWLALYRSELERPVVQGWLREQKIDPGTLKITPSTGALSASVDGVLKHFSLTDSSGWRQIAGPLLEIAKVIAPDANKPLNVSFGTNSMAASLKTVAKFYAERAPANVAGSRTRIAQLNSQKTFDAPTTEKQSAQALETQRTNAEKVYAEAPQKLAFTKLATGVAQAYPNPRTEAKQQAENILRAHLPKDELAKLEPLNADNLYLHRFHGNAAAGTTDKTLSGRQFNVEPSLSKTLTEAVLANFSEQDWLPGMLDADAAIYTVGPGQTAKNGHYGEGNEVRLAPSVFMRGVADADLQSRVTEQITQFWKTQGTDYRTVQKGNFVNQARQQLKAFELKTPAEQALQAAEHTFTRDDYTLVMAAANVPLDEKAPTTVEQLQTESPAKGKLRAHVFDINGYPSNIIRLADLDDGQSNYENNRRDGRQILYIPDATPAFVRFDSLKKMDDWVVEQAKDPKKREALASHFSLYDRQDGGLFGKYGVDSSLAHLANGNWEHWEGKTIDRGNVNIDGDVFTHLQNEAKERMTSDADTVIKSNSEVTRDTWLNDLSAAAGLLGKLAPLGAPIAGIAVLTGAAELTIGAERNRSGDTQAERTDGAWKVFDGALNTLFSAGASGTVKDPFELPVEEPLPPGKPTIAVDENEIKAPQAGGSGNRPTPGISDSTVNRFRMPSSSLVKMSEHVVPNGEQFIANTAPDALGVYRVTDSEGKRWNFVRHTDETGSSKVFEIESRYRMGDSATSIISPATGRAVMRIHPGSEGEWVRAPADGGMRIKWLWERTPSPTPSDEMKSPRSFASQFGDNDDKLLPLAQRADELLKFNDAIHYTLGSKNYEANGAIKANTIVSWNIDDTGFSVEPSEKAQFTQHSLSEYSPNFLLDLNRNPYAVTTTENGLSVTHQLNAGASTSEGIREARLKQFEETIADPDLRARISEVAHQGALGPGSSNLNGTTLQDGYFFAADDTQFHIDHDPAKNLVNVRITAKGHLSNPGQEISRVPGAEITITRFFTIRESNELGSSYAIDKNAPSHIAVSIAPNP